MSSVPSAAGPLTGRLVFRARSGATQAFPLKGDETLLGRDARPGVSVAMEGISRRHARIVFDGKSYWLEDLRSTNGTFLNGQPVRKDRLRHLDVITLGKKLDLLFLLRALEPRRSVKRQGIMRAALVPSDAPDAPHEVGVGELTLGRSASCNVQVESGAVSKVHAQLRRTADQLVVQDLGSSNGTFVNGARVSVAELRHGDVLSLAGVEAFRVFVELGEVTTSGSYPAVSLGASQALERPRFSNAWKTRLEWDSEELRQIAEAQKAGVALAERTLMPKAAAKPALPVPKPAAAAPASRPPAPAAPKPQPQTPAPQPPRAAPAAPSPAPVSTPPATPRSAPAAPQEVASVAPPNAARTATPRIAEVRLSGGGYELLAAATGAHGLGRAKDAPLRIDHPTISRRHARIIVSDDRSTAYLQDMGGANGTILNGVELRELKPLQDGDRVRVGNVELTVSLKKV